MVFVYKGTLHIHSSYSDGSGSIEKIAFAAKKAGLDFIIITDHNNLKGLKEGKEGWYDGVAVTFGEEISPDDGDHYLAFNIKDKVSHNMKPEEFIAEVKKQGGFGFIAHPDENPKRKNSYKPLRWSNWDIKGFDGLEIWNHLSDWVDVYSPATVVRDYFLRDRVVKGPSADVLQWWDRLNNENKEIVPAIGGVDAHALKFRYYGLDFIVFPYEYTFKTVTNHIMLESELSKSFEEAKRQIHEALKSGKNFIANRVWNKKELTTPFWIEDNNQKVFPGSTAGFAKEAKAFIKLPQKGLIKIIRNGKLIYENKAQEAEFEIKESGKYRVEVYYKNSPWIFTNPVNVSFGG
jgi:hypothetical protein